MTRLSLGTAPAGATVNAHRVGAAASLGPVVESAVADQWGAVEFPAGSLQPGVQYIAALQDGARLCFFRERGLGEPRDVDLPPGWPIAFR